MKKVLIVSTTIYIIVSFLFSCKPKVDLKTLLKQAIVNRDSVLVITGGTYIIDEPIQLTEASNLVIKGEPSVNIVITSGMDVPIKKLTCIDKEIGIYEITLPELIMPTWPDAFKGYAGWPEIYIDGIPLNLCRYPNEGFIKADSIIVAGNRPKDNESEHVPARFVSNELTENYNPEYPLFLNGYWKFKWADEIIRVASVDQNTGEINLAAPHHYGMGSPSGGLFYAINQPEYLDIENEYFFNPETGTIRFIHFFSGEKVKSIKIGYRDFTLFDIQDCNQVKIENIKFAFHNNLAVRISNSESVEISNCQFYGMGRSAVEITGGKNCGLNNCSFKYLGSTGVTLTGGDKNTLTKSKHFVKDCDISHYARHVKTYAPGVHLIGVGHIVTGNSISVAPHNAILFTGNDHLIANNKISNVCLNTSDAGAIYCGRDWTMGGTVIKENTIRDLGQASHHHNWAIYLDDLASGIVVKDNIIEDCPSGILIGGGRYNKINGNQLRNCPKASVMYDARGYAGWFRPHLDDRNLSLWPRLNAVPISQKPWSERFPWLQDIENDDPALPRGAEILNNQILNSAKPQIHHKVYEYGNVDIKLIQH